MKTSLRPEPTPAAVAEWMKTLQVRFQRHPQRHLGLAWESVVVRLKGRTESLSTLLAMEQTGGEPDVVGQGGVSGELFFVDCAPESPAGRRSLCYDDAALRGRKPPLPEGSAVQIAAAMGLRLLTEDEYFSLQAVGPFDQKTSSWLATPEEIRARDGALFGDHRYGRTFIYHNGAQSYFAARGFRGGLSV